MVLLYKIYLHKLILILVILEHDVKSELSQEEYQQVFQAIKYFQLSVVLDTLNHFLRRILLALIFCLLELQIQLAFTHRSLNYGLLKKLTYYYNKNSESNDLTAASIHLFGSFVKGLCPFRQIFTFLN